MLIKPNRPFSARISSLPFKTFFPSNSICVAGCVIWLVVILRMRSRTPLFNATDAQYEEFNSHTNEPAYVCVCVSIGDRAIWFSDYYLFSLHPVFACECVWRIVHLHTFAPHRSLVIFVWFYALLPLAHFSPSIVRLLTIQLSFVPYVCVVVVVLASFTLSKLAFNRNQIDSGE